MTELEIVMWGDGSPQGKPGLSHLSPTTGDCPERGSGWEWRDKVACLGPAGGVCVSLTGACWVVTSGRVWM